MKRVKVDFSTAVRGGMIRGNQLRSSHQLREGDRVEAYDPAEGLEFTRTVAEITPDGQFAYLRMDWDEHTVSHPAPEQRDQA